MNTRFYNAKILVLDAENHFSIAEDELHVTGDTITYIGPVSYTHLTLPTILLV